jgi:uncharacterized protein YqgC (DUF456 family)
MKIPSANGLILLCRATIVYSISSEKFEKTIYYLALGIIESLRITVDHNNTSNLNNKKPIR